MTKEDLQKIINSFLEGKGPKADVESIADGIAKISVVGKCGGGCGCSHEAFDAIKKNILENHKEVRGVERINA